MVRMYIFISSYIFISEQRRSFSHFEIFLQTTPPPPPPLIVTGVWPINNGSRSTWPTQEVKLGDTADGAVEGWRVFPTVRSQPVLQPSLNRVIIDLDNVLSPGRCQDIYLNECTTIKWAFRNKFQWNLNRNMIIFIKEKHLKHHLLNGSHFVVASMWNVIWIISTQGPPEGLLPLRSSLPQPVP